MRGLNDKIVIVTGGGSGLGRGMAKRLADEGAIIAIFDIDKKGAAETRTKKVRKSSEVKKSKQKGSSQNNGTSPKIKRRQDKESKKKRT